MIALLKVLMTRLTAICLMTTILHMALPDSKIKKYFSFLAGIMIIFCVTSTFIDFSKECGAFDAELLTEIQEDAIAQMLDEEQCRKFAAAWIGANIKMCVEDYCSENQFNIIVSDAVPVFKKTAFWDEHTIECLNIYVLPQAEVEGGEIMSIKKFLSDKYLIESAKIYFYEDKDNGKNKK